MNLSDFLDAVKPTLQPDIPYERQVALGCGADPENYDEEVWLDWQNS